MASRDRHGKWVVIGLSGTKLQHSSDGKHWHDYRRGRFLKHRRFVVPMPKKAPTELHYFHD